MAKRFFETFPTLILEDELKDLFEFAEVTALKYNRDRTAIHVYLSPSDFKAADLCGGI